MTDEAAAALGRKRWEKVTPKERSKAGRLAVEARWKKYYEDHPDKLKTRRSGVSRKKSKAPEK
jgi:hypothetical protein